MSCQRSRRCSPSLLATFPLFSFLLRLDSLLVPATSFLISPAVMCRCPCTCFFCSELPFTFGLALALAFRRHFGTACPRSSCRSNSAHLPLLLTVLVSSKGHRQRRSSLSSPSFVSLVHQHGVVPKATPIYLASRFQFAAVGPFSSLPARRSVSFAPPSFVPTGPLLCLWSLIRIPASLNT